MSLRDEIAADIYGDDLTEDLFEDVELNGTTVPAMVGVEMLADAMDDLGGVVRTSERAFKFRLLDLQSLGESAGLDAVICYEGEKYDVTQADARSGWPLIAVRATLRK